MRVAVTGNMGFIGTRLMAALAGVGGLSVRTYDKRAGRNILDTTIEDADVIFHLAAQTSVQDSVENPMFDAENNIAGTIKLLCENQDAKIVLTGSCAASDPQSPYGISKLAQELYAGVLHRNAVVCRLPNVFGEDDRGVVGAFLRSERCTVFGDGLQTRDFVHVDDICDGLVMAMGWEPGTYEFGSGRSVSVKDLARATGKRIVHAKALPGEIREVAMRNTTPDWKPKTDVIDFIRERSCK